MESVHNNIGLEYEKSRKRIVGIEVENIYEVFYNVFKSAKEVAMSLLDLIKPVDGIVKSKLQNSSASLEDLRKKYGVSDYIFFLLDCSGSMGGDKFDQAKKGINDFSEKIFNAHLDFIAFSTKARIVANFEEVEVGGATNMFAAIALAHKNMSGNGKQTIILATDGQADELNKTIQAASVAKEDGIKIICIGTDDADEEFLKKLSSRKDLGKKVPQKDFRQAIAQSANFLLT
jgi:uncharacterized protein YegL